MNKVIFIGRLGKDAQVRGSSDRPIVAFTLAVNSPMPNGETDTQWFSCSAFNTLAKFLAGVLPKKGTRVLIEGKVKRRTFTDSQGVEKTDMEVIVDHFQFIDPRDPRPDTSATDGSPSAYAHDAQARAPHDIWR
jgi:single-strand DNA-binding protein